MSDDKVKFTSGATSSKGHDAPYWLMTGCAVKLGALRFGAGNVKHENSDTVLANANWLKAFHARDLDFFRNRYAHARDHMDAEMQGRVDADPGGNIGAVMWFLEVIAFIKDHDPEFYYAIQGRQKYPGARELPCQCPRCAADLTINLPGAKPKLLRCARCKIIWYESELCSDCFCCPDDCPCL